MRPARLTPAVHRLVALDQHHRPPIGRLSEAQVRTLTQVAIRPAAFEQRVSAPLAIRALARGAGAARAVPILARLLGARAAAPPTRIAAARELALIGTAEAERALLRRTRVEDPHVRRAVLRALGSIGGPAALRALTRMREPADPAARRRLLFARALIAHRHGLEGASLPPVEGEPRRPEQIGDRTTLTAVLESVAATAKDRERLRGSTFGIRLAPRAIRLLCGRAERTVFFNRELDPSRMAVRLRKRPWVLGLIVSWTSERRLAGVKHIILTTPEDDGVRVDIVRRDGRRTYTGRATVDGGTLQFTITDTERPATAPAYVTGHLTARGIVLDRVAVSGRRIGVRPTVALLPPTRSRALVPDSVGKGDYPWR